MNKSLIALCLLAGLLASAPGTSLVDVNYAPQNANDTPTIPSAALQQLIWIPVDQSKTQTTQLATGDQQLNVLGVNGPVATYSVPANIGELTLMPTSGVNKQTSVSASNVLILGQNMIPSVFFPSGYLTCQEPGAVGAGRLESATRLTSTLGQQKLYALTSIMEKNLQQTTQLLDPVKAYAKGTDNSISGIPDPVVHHTTDGLLKLKAKTNSSSGVLVGPLFGSSAPAPVTVDNTATSAVTAPASAPVKKSELMLSNTESYLNTAIKNVAAKGDADKALKLLDEVERLGSTSARSTFISNVKGKG